MHVTHLLMDLPPMQREPDSSIHETLQHVFGFKQFRPHQQAIVEAILDRRDVFAVMPTGGGKSLCYQLPAYLFPGICMVISPLISLMKDQVDAARRIGLRADYLNSSQSREEQETVRKRLTSGQLDMLYISPERFAMSDFRATLGEVLLSFIAIDEAHCISDWGHDFRPDYLGLAEIKSCLPDTPIAAFTATATLKVQSDIIQKLKLDHPHCVRASFNRPNLFYRVQPKHNTEQQILADIQRQAGQCGIVYRTTRADVDEHSDTPRCRMCDRCRPNTN